MEFRKQLKSIKENEILRLEKELGIQIPKSYRDFLLEFYGGKPLKSNFYKILKTGGVFDFEVNLFLGISNKSAYDLQSTYIRMLGSVPQGLLPISDDGIGNKICIGLKDEFLGEIFVWWIDGQVYENEQPTFENIVKIADSFEEFKEYLK